MSDPIGLFHELAPLHTHHEVCGEPVLFDVGRQVFTSIYDGSDHACSEVDTDECDCGVVLSLSRWGRLYERDTKRPHFCQLAVDRAERGLAHDRGSWSHQPVHGWTIPIRPAHPGEAERDRPVVRRIGRSFLP